MEEAYISTWRRVVQAYLFTSQDNRCVCDSALSEGGQRTLQYVNNCYTNIEVRYVFFAFVTSAIELKL